jgi:inosine-uridine nucleoside N-ribohydrolase
MARKVILDVDPGIDDAMALCVALSNPEWDVVAVTAVAGNVPAAQATRNVQAVIEQLDPPRWPRLGAASEPDNHVAADRGNLYGSDGLGGASFVVAERQHLLPSEKVICDHVRDAPHEVTIVALGPLTNIARAFIRDPDLATLVGRIVIMGGTVSGAGNITPAAEFNMYCDPVAARTVFRSPSTKTLVPLDVTNRIELDYDIFHRLPDEGTRVGRLLRQILPPVFRGYRQQFGLEGIHVHDTVTLMAAMYPTLFTTKSMPGDVEILGELTTGATIFDRRRVPAWRHNMEVAIDVDKDGVIDAILRGLNGLHGSK